MSSPPSGEPDLEIEFMVCRCAAPADLADQIHEYFEARDLRIERRVRPNTRATVELSVRQVRYIEIKRITGARRVQATPVLEMTMLYEGTANVWSLGSAVTAGAEMVAEFAGEATQPLPAAIWMPVFNVYTFARTGVALHVYSEAETDQQLEALAPALDLPRERITIKPPPGWCGYGHPDLWPPQPPGRR